MNNIEEIASKHLGKAGDGSVVKPYVTPEKVDKSLLVAIPRHLNRTQYEIDDEDLPFVGFDTWNCYEFSTLLDNGFPVSGLIKIIYPANSSSIVESKSLKLYMNSFNMDRMGKTYSDAVDNVLKVIQEDLSEALECDVKVGFFNGSHINHAVPITGAFNQLEEICPIEDMDFSQYNEDPNILEAESVDWKFTAYKSYSLRSNCRVTNQPDWGDVYIWMSGGKNPTPESLLKYIASMRKENHFHEEICECIYKRLLDKFNPKHLFVACLYTRRGGIDINPVRATDIDTAERFAMAMRHPGVSLVKTLRQ